MRHPELPVVAFLTAFLVIIPLPWHWRAHNVATVALMLWLYAVDVIYGVNAIVWAGNVNNPIPVWCDIATKIVVGASYALPLCTLCICKHLESVASSRHVSYNANDKRRRIIFESVMCFGIPAIFMALHYVVQGHRFDIFEDVGCQAALYISLPAVLIVWFPQLLFSVITLIYAAMALRHFIRRRLVFAAHLQSSGSALTTGRYFRLIAMSVTEMVWGTTFTAYNMYNNISGGLRPWTTWNDVHSNFSRVAVYPASLIPPQLFSAMMLLWWVLPASSLIFFIFFGFGEEALKEYRKVWTFFRKNILRIKDDEKKISILPPFLKFKGVRPLRLVEQSMDKEKQAFSSMASYSPSSATITPTTPTKSFPTVDDDAFTFTSLSYYGGSTDSVYIQNDSHVVGDDDSINPAIPTTAPQHVLRPNLSRFHDNLPSPVYHPPFTLPSVCPIADAHMKPQNGILVTIHRQASADDIA